MSEFLYSLLLRILATVVEIIRGCVSVGGVGWGACMWGRSVLLAARVCWGVGGGVRVLRGVLSVCCELRHACVVRGKPTNRYSEYITKSSRVTGRAGGAEHGKREKEHAERRGLFYTRGEL